MGSLHFKFRKLGTESVDRQENKLKLQYRKLWFESIYSFLITFFDYFGVSFELFVTEGNQTKCMI